MVKMRGFARGFASAVGKVGGAYVKRSRGLYDYYNCDPLTGKRLGSREILKNHRFFFGGAILWYGGIGLVGGSFLPEFFSEKDYSSLESYLRIGGFSLMTFGALCSSIFYSRMNGFKDIGEAFLENPKRATSKLTGGFVDSQIVAPTYKVLVVGKWTEKSRQTANRFGGSFSERAIDPLCLRILDYIGSKGKIGRGLNDLAVRTSETFYGIYH